MTNRQTFRGLVCSVLLISSVTVAGERWEAFKKKTGAIFQGGKDKVVQGTTAIVNTGKDVVHTLRYDLKPAIDSVLHPIDGVNVFMAALGDSISAGVNAVCPFGRCPVPTLKHHQFDLNFIKHKHLSWATGQGIDSMVERLRAAGAGKVEGLPIAVPSSDSSNLNEQLNKVFKHYTPNKVTILTGANNICGGVADPEASSKDYEGHVQAAVERLVKARSNVKIVLAGIPNLENLHEVNKNRRVGPAKIHCQDIWDTLKFCKPLLDQKATSDDKFNVMKRLQLFNQKLADIADRYPRNVRVAKKLAEAKFQAEHISGIDCFHPNIEGQKGMAKVVWEEVGDWFAKL